MKMYFTLGSAIIFFASACSPPENTSDVNASVNISTYSQSAMKITSQAFEHNQYIPAKYTCDGEDVNPPITISQVPEDTKSLVLIMDDPDAPAGTWVHWTVWKIDPKTTNIEENSVPLNAFLGKTSFGKPGYGGPCPPSGTHRYFFKLYALDLQLDAPQGAHINILIKEMEGHILDQAELIGLYARE